MILCWQVIFKIVICRCMEEGADEFFLKPVQLSDMSRLKPHILKKSSKCQDQNQNKSVSTTISSSTNNVSGNKRKATDDGICPERIRPRYSGGPVTIVWDLDSWLVLFFVFVFVVHFVLFWGVYILFWRIYRKKLKAGYVGKQFCPAD